MNKLELCEIISKLSPAELEITKTEKSILLHIIMLSDSNYVCYLTQGALSTYIGCSSNTISTAVFNLRRKNY